jgi:diaminopimelate decarboxylase/aspartate kinase
VSIDEVAAARAAVPDLDPADILYTPNFAPREEYRAALAAGVRVTLDALHPLAEWGADFSGQAVFLRVDLGVGRGHHDKVRTGGAASKFGVALDDVGAFRDLARRHGVRIVGLHTHAGSGVLDADHWRATGAQLAGIAQSFDDVAVLDLGGGIGVPEHADEAPLDLDMLAAGLAEVRRAYPQFALWMEPGRFLVAEAGVLLARVTQTKRKGAMRYVGVDAGMNSLLRPALYDAWHEIVNLDRLDEEDAELVQVVGPICETGDVLGRNRRLPVCREGDVLLFANAGAYGAAMASRYNLREPAAELAIHPSPLRGEGGGEGKSDNKGKT